MVKFLVAGCLDSTNDGWVSLTSRVKALQSSQHGPFAVLLVSGALFSTKEQYDSAMQQGAPALEIPTFITSLPLFVVENGGRLPGNVQCLATAGMQHVGLATVATLTVAFVNSCKAPSTELDALRVQTSSASYRGCDVLLSDDWPKDMHHFIDESEYQSLQQLVGPGFLGAGNNGVTIVSTIVRPRYHFSSAHVFFQRTPYRNFASASSPSPVTRFISLAPVSASKDKDKKWLHALSLDPIVYMSASELVEEPAGTTDSPYVSVGTKTLARPQQLTLQERVASENDAKRMRLTGAGSHFFGHLSAARPSASSLGALPTAPAAHSVNLVPPSSTATTLFVGNMPRVAPGSISRPDAELKSLLPSCLAVRIQEGKAFAFAEFESHGAAKSVVDACTRPGGAVSLQGRVLSIGWAASQSINRAPAAVASTGGIKAATAAVEEPIAPPSADAKTLFLGGLPFNRSVDGPPLVSIADLAPLLEGVASLRVVPGKAFAFVEFESHEAALAAVKRFKDIPLTLQGPAREVGDNQQSSTAYEVSVSWAKESTRPAPTALPQSASLLSGHPREPPSREPPSDSSSCLFVGGVPKTADEASILSVFRVYVGGEDGLSLPTIRRPEGKAYAFIDFSSHALAVRALASAPEEPTVAGKTVSLGWAKGKSLGKAPQQSKSDHTAACWFCLASPELKAHLVVSVATHSYLALPRGALHPLHCLISPVECMPNKLHLPSAALAEMQLYESKVGLLFAKHGMAALVFERCIRTLGRDHMQVQIVPMPIARVPGALTVFFDVAAAHALKFREITDDRGVDEVVVSMEGGPFQEYFYITVPTGQGLGPEAKSKRFLFVLEEEKLPPEEGPDGNTAKPVRFPMQFGTEVAAQVLGQPEKAHWKNCVLAVEEEERQALAFREQFSEFDFAEE